MILAYQYLFYPAVSRAIARPLTGRQFLYKYLVEKIIPMGMWLVSLYFPGAQLF
jgi:hypothetical protein